MSPPFTDPSPVFLDTDLALGQIGSEQAMDNMLVLLEESLTRDIPLIARHLSQGDVPAANRVLHAMKGVMPIFCGDALCQHVTRVEGLSKTGSASEVSGAYAALRPDLECLLAEVTRYLGDDVGD